LSSSNSALSRSRRQQLDAFAQFVEIGPLGLILQLIDLMQQCEPLLQFVEVGPVGLTFQPSYLLKISARLRNSSVVTAITGYSFSWLHMVQGGQV
jgi:hypothetical protein